MGNTVTMKSCHTTYTSTIVHMIGPTRARNKTILLLWHFVLAYRDLVGHNAAATARFLKFLFQKQEIFHTHTVHNVCKNVEFMCTKI